MKINRVRLWSANGVQDISLSFNDPDATNPYIARSILGLDAGEIVPKFYGSGTYNNFYNMSLPPRDITFSIALNPNFATNQNHSQLRDDLYRAVASTRSGLIEIQFWYNATQLVSIWGFIVKLENNLFNKQQEVKLIIRCDDPLFKAPVITDEFYEMTNDLFTINDMLSTAPHGLQFSGRFDAPATEFVLKDQVGTPSWTFIIQPGLIIHPVSLSEDTGFLTNDELWFSSEAGNKYLYIMRDGAQIHLANKIVPGSFWPLIFPVSVAFEVEPAAFYWYEFRHYHTYMGV